MSNKIKNAIIVGGKMYELKDDRENSKVRMIMTNNKTIDRWADSIIPAVFRAEEALQKAKPEWKVRLAALSNGTSTEDPHKVAEEYCREIATIIVTQGSEEDSLPTSPMGGE